MSFNLSVAETIKLIKEVSLTIVFDHGNEHGITINHVTKVDISNSGIVSIWNDYFLICTLNKKDIYTLCYIPYNHSEKDLCYIIYAGELV